MILQLRRRSSGYWNDICRTSSLKFHGEKWSKTFGDKIVVVVLVTLCFISCWRDIKADKLNYLHVTAGNNLSQLNRACTNQTDNSDGFNVLEIIHNMHFDFCDEIHPVFFIPNVTIFSNEPTFNILINSSKWSKGIEIVVPAVYSCSDIQNLYNTYLWYEEIFINYGQVLDRLDDCTLQKSINCTICKVRYLFNFGKFKCIRLK